MNPLGSSSLSAVESREPRGYPVISEGTADRYAIYEEIGAGGMATVHLGRLTGPANFARTVAIKRLHPHLARQSEFVAMFLDEARLAARIRHPNVVTTLDVVTTSAQLFLVMEYVRGESLARLAERRRRESGARPADRRLRDRRRESCTGSTPRTRPRTSAANPSAIVHRDVSPQNVMVGADGVARVLDFGVAKAAGRLQTTREGRLKGKLAYMAPELVRGEAVSRGGGRLLGRGRPLGAAHGRAALHRRQRGERPRARPLRRGRGAEPSRARRASGARRDRPAGARPRSRQIGSRRRGRWPAPSSIARSSRAARRSASGWRGSPGRRSSNRARKTARIESGACPPLEDLPFDAGSLSEGGATRRPIPACPRRLAFL